MKILGIDTTTKFLALGVYDNAKVCEYNMELDRRHSALLMAIIKRALDSLGLSIKEIDYFACGIGPGSFTGVRVGLSAMKGFSYSLNKPILGISTLDMLASNVKPDSRTIVSAIDAKRNLIYCSAYKNHDGRLKKTMPYRLLGEEAFFAKIPDNSLVLGDAAGLYKEKILSRIKGVTVLEKDYWFPQGRNIIRLALERIKSGKLDNPFDIKPIYLYPKECQIKHAQQR